MIARARRRLRSLRLRTVVLLTAVPGLLLPFFFFRSVAEFGAIAVGYPPDVQRVLDRPGAVWWLWRRKLEGLPRLLTASRVEERVPTERLWANGEIHLHVPGSTWDALLADLPVSGETYRPVQVWNGGRYRKARLRLRGNSGFHWLPPKRSLKLKTTKKHLLRGYRRINLTVKHPYVESLAHEVALEWGLLAPVSHPVRVFVDGKLYGTLRFLEEVDESFLRRHGRMPGDVFKGEGAPFTNEWAWGLPVNFLLHRPFPWPKIARDNTLPPAHRDELVAMSRALDTPGAGGVLELQRLFDPGVAAAHVAYHLFLNEHHAVDGNNLKLFVDPLDGKIEPIVWDPYLGSNERVFSESPDPRYPVVNAVFHRMGADPRFMHRVFRFLKLRLEDFAGVEARIERLWEDLRANAASFAVERENPTFPIRAWFFDAHVRVLRENRLRILDRLDRVELLFEGREGAVILGCRGLSGVEVTALRLSRRPDGGSFRAGSLGPGGWLEPGGRVLPGRVEIRGDGPWFVPESPLRVLPAATGPNRVEPVPLPYPVGLPAGMEVTGFSAENALTGEPVPAVPVERWPDPAAEVLHPWSLPLRPEPAVRTLRGSEVRLPDGLTVARHETLVIAPGTRLLLGPGAHVRVYGRIRAEGEPGRPIAFEPLEPGRPWGVLALQGDGASGSVFRHVRFTGGSEARFGALRYPGMVNVHRARDVLFEHCEFHHNVVGDDALRAADAVVEVRDSSFHDTHADAIDLDLSTGVIAGCTFERVGNDAIDLMGSSPLIAGNAMAGCGDKGISVGERSDPVIVDNRISGAAVGIQVKDASDPLILASEITGCGIGVESFRKNWRYGAGGRGRVVNSVVRGNDLDLAVREQSRLLVRNSVVGRIPPGEDGLVLDSVAPAGHVPPPPDPAEWAILSGAPVPLEPGLAGTGGTLSLRRLAADDRFRDGFRLEAGGWSLGGSGRLFVRAGILRAGLRDRDAVLGRDFGLEDLPGGSRLHLRLAASRPAAVTLQVETGEGELLRTLALGPTERTIVLELPPGRLGRVRLRADTRTTLRLRRAWVSLP